MGGGSQKRRRKDGDVWPVAGERKADIIYDEIWQQKCYNDRSWKGDGRFRFYRMERARPARLSPHGCRKPLESLAT